MRTTLTIDDDVAAELEALRQAQRVSLKALINDALRRGLIEMRRSRKPARKPFRTKSFDVGEARIPIDNVAEALAIAEAKISRDPRRRQHPRLRDRHHISPARARPPVAGYPAQR